MELQNARDAMMCRTFPLTLGDRAQRWFRLLPTSLIGCWDDLALRFLTHFLGSKARTFPKQRLVTVKQNRGESLRKYLDHFNKLAMEMERVSDDAMLMVVISGLQPQTRFWWSVHENGPKSYHEFLQQAESFIGVEEATSSFIEQKTENPRGNNEQKEGRRGTEAGLPLIPQAAFKPFQESPQVQMVRSVLRASPGDVFKQIKDDNVLEKPRPIRTEVAKLDQSRYCRYHRSVGHDTDECINLVEELLCVIGEGKLRDTIRRNFPKNKGPQVQNDQVAPLPISEHQQDHNQQPRNEIHMFRSFNMDKETSSRRVRRRMVCQVNNSYQISNFLDLSNYQDDYLIPFRKVDADEIIVPHNDPLLVTLDISGFRVHRIMVDTESYANIIYVSAFLHMAISPSEVRPCNEQVVGVTGDIMKVIGEVDLEVVMGEPSHQAAYMEVFKNYRCPKGLQLNNRQTTLGGVKGHFIHIPLLLLRYFYACI